MTSSSKWGVNTAVRPSKERLDRQEWSEPVSHGPHCLKAARAVREPVHNPEVLIGQLPNAARPPRDRRSQLVEGGWIHRQTPEHARPGFGIATAQGEPGRACNLEQRTAIADQHGEAERQRLIDHETVRLVAQRGEDGEITRTHPFGKAEQPSLRRPGAVEVYG